MINTIDGILAAAKELEGGVIAVAAAHDDVTLQAVVDAKRSGIAESVLVGHENEIRAILAELGESPDDYRILDADTDQDCAKAAVREVKEGRASFLMKGLLNTADLMRAVLDREHGLRTNNLVAHCMLHETPSYPRMFIVTDGGVNTFPDLAQKADILENAARILQALGYEQISAACICGAENVNPKIQATVDAAALADMKERWTPYNMSVYGPVGLDLAVSLEACEHKGYHAKGAGEADIILAPDYQVGNGISKAASLFGGARTAGIILGAKAPIVLVSRSDSSDSKLASIALGGLLAHRMQL